MSRTGLGQFGVMPLTIIREPTRDSEDIHICLECDHPVVKLKGYQRIEKPDLVHVALATTFDELVDSADMFSDFMISFRGRMS